MICNLTNQQLTWFVIWLINNLHDEPCSPVGRPAGSLHLRIEWGQIAKIFLDCYHNSEMRIKSIYGSKLSFLYYKKSKASPCLNYFINQNRWWLCLRKTFLLYNRLSFLFYSSPEKTRHTLSHLMPYFKVSFQKIIKKHRNTVPIN